jgi:hypothetical protein
MTRAPATTLHATERQQLEISVAHGSLEHAHYPVVVGHNQGMPLNGAEGFLDQRLGGRLSERLLLNAYAEEEGVAVAVALIGPRPLLLHA